MHQTKPSPAPPDVRLRDIRPDDLPTLFAQQDDPAACQMAACPSRDWPAFQAHWQRVLSTPSLVTRAIEADGQLAGNIVSFELDGERAVGYWLGCDYWGRGVASAALAAFLPLLPERPLHAHVAKHNIGSRRVLEKCGFTIVGENPAPPAAPGGAVDEWVLILR